MERRFLAFDRCPVKLEQRGTDPPRVTGYGAVYYDGTASTEYQLYEDVVERILPGCFDRALRDQDIFCLVNHDENQVLGRKSAKTAIFRADNTGLYYEALPPNTQAARDACELITRGDVTGSSFTFAVKSQRWTKAAGGMTIRELMDVDLRDCGPVTFPAYAGTSAKMRALDDLVEARKALDRFRSDQAHDDEMLAHLLAGYRVRAAQVLDDK